MSRKARAYLIDPVVAVSQHLQAIARIVDRELARTADRRMRFSLFVWPPETGGRVNYVANADRADVQRAIEEVLARWKANQPDPPAHEVN